MPGNAADRAPTLGTRAAEINIFILGLDAPLTRLLIGLGEGKRERVLEDITVVETEFILDIDRALAFEAGAAVARDSRRAAPPARPRD